MRENGTKSVSRQQHNLAQVLEKRQQRRAQSAKEANHYGKVITDQWTVNVRIIITAWLWRCNSSSRKPICRFYRREGLQLRLMQSCVKDGL